MRVAALVSAMVMAVAAPASAQPAPLPAQHVEMFGEALTARLGALRARVAELATETPRIPAEIARTLDASATTLPPGEATRAAGYLLAFLLAGWAAEQALMRGSRRWKDRIVHASQETLEGRSGIILERLLFAVLLLAAWSAGAVGGFLLVAFPPLEATLITGYLLAAFAVGVSLVLTRFVLAPAVPELRLVAVPTRAARFWHIGCALLTAFAAFGWQTVAALSVRGLRAGTADALSLLIGLGTVVGAALLIWVGRRLLPGTRARATRRFAVAASLYLAAVWLAYLAGAAPSGWLIIVAGVVPFAVLLVHRVVRGVVIGPAGSRARPVPPLAVLIERAIQGGLVLAGAAILAASWGFDPDALLLLDTPRARLVSGLLEAVLVVVAADLAWQMARVAIDARLHEATTDPGGLDDAEQRRRARVLTLLPVLRSVALILVLTIGMMTAFSALGVQIAPLLAGAGVVGVAIGFGAQTLVRDVLAGIFFLLDDAFRVGEYVESGALRGNVEAFSLRSIKLRDYNGRLQTVPFGEMKTVTNYSREWVAEEISFALSYENDLAVVERAVALASEALSADPTVAGAIIEPLASFGVSKMGETGITLVLSVKTRPGQQFLVRRTAFRHLKLAFEAQGIRFALPIVQFSDRPRPGLPGP